jgi:antitoxin CptB
MPDSPSDDLSPLGLLDNRRRRLLFRATHRGTHENDLLIGGYVAARIHTLSETEITALEEVMELPDTDLADWLTGRQPIPPESDSPTLRAIRAAALERHPPA